MGWLPALSRRVPLPLKRLLKPPLVLFLRLVVALKVRIASDATRAWTAAGGALSFAGSVHRRGGQIVERVEGSGDLAGAGRVAIFSHYDAVGTIRPYVRHHVDELVRAGFAVVFVTNSAQLGPDERSWIGRRCALGLRRRNLGRDFGAYKDALEVLGDLSRLDALLLTNDSVYGPLIDLGTVLDRLDLSAIDVWGITDSPQHRPHLQSYFLLLGPRALRSDAFHDFWSRVRYVRSKHWVIRRYEIGLSQRLMADGMRCEALCPYDSVATAFLASTDDASSSRDEDRRLASIRKLVSRDVPVNPSHFLWDTLLTQMGCPFLKRQLLIENPGKVPFTDRWEDVVTSVSGYDPALIADDLRMAGVDSREAALHQGAGS